MCSNQNDLLNCFNFINVYFKMKNIKLLKPQPSPKNGRQPLANITNCFHSRPRSQKQNHHSPSHSPSNSSRISQIQTKRVLTPKAPLEARFMQMPTRCINHREKQGKFRVQGDSSSCNYCQSCAVQLNQKGKRLIPIKSEDPSSKMVTQAKQYLRSIDEVMQKISQKNNEAKMERYKINSRYNNIQEDIEQERRNIIDKINCQYDAQIRKVLQAKTKEIAKIQEEQQQLKKIEHDFGTIRSDISDNMNQMNVNIDFAEFRQIMNIYWQKIAKVNEKLSKQLITPVIDSTQAFINKYLPPVDQPQRMTFQQNIKKLRPNTPTGKQFTFSKIIAPNKCKQTYSWQLSNPSSQSVQSIVQQKIKIK